MGRRGPRPTPAPLRLLTGNPARRPVPPEPSPEKGPTDPPEHLAGEARVVWHRLAPELVAKGLMAPRYLDNFADFCVAVVATQASARLLQAAGPVISKDGVLVSNPASREFRHYARLVRDLGADFGMTPASLTNIARAMATPEPAGGPERLLG
jgi:P27 family predicted phage terminase small subunit